MAQHEQLTPKDVKCKCGNVLTLDKKSDWCTKCVRKVFYDPKDQRRHTINNIYMRVLAVSIMFFLIYVFFELIITPMSKL